MDNPNQRINVFCFKRLLAYVFTIVIAAFLVSGCASKAFRMNLLEPSSPAQMPRVAVDSVNIESSDGSTLFKALQVTLPGKVLDAFYEPDSGLILAKYSTEKDTTKTPSVGRFVMYDLDSSKVMWMSEGNPTISYFDGKFVVLEHGNKIKNYYVPRYKFWNDVSPDLHFYEDGNVICLNKEKCAKVDFSNDLEYWKKEGLQWHGFLWTKREGDWLYAVADGLRALRLEDGEGWYFDAATGRSQTGEVIAATVAANIVGAALGMAFIPTRIPQEHNCCSYPLIIDDRIYFAAKKKVFCLNQSSGDALWQNELDIKPSVMGIWQAGSAVALVSKGYKYVDYIAKKTDPPTILLIDSDSGDILARTSIEQSEIAMDFLWTPDYSFLLTPEHLYKYDNNLNLVGVVDELPENCFFMSFLDQEAEPLMVRTAKGAIGIDPASLEVLWQTDVGEIWKLKKTGKSKQRDQIMMLLASFPSLSHQLQDKQGIWLSSTGALSLVDAGGNGQVITQLPQYSWQHWKDNMVVCAGKTITIFDDPVNK